MKPFWTLTIPETVETLHADPARGLTAEEAARRLAATGPNQLREKKGESPWMLFLQQFNNFIIWVLLGAALLSGFLKEWVDTAAIGGIVILNAVLGFIQEFRAEKALAALRRMASPASKVIRDGHLLTIPSAELVPGDLVELEAGDHVPADARVISHTAQFAVQEASLTGESTPIAKTMGPIDGENIPLGDRTNLVFLGTAVVAGKSRVIIASTGMATELGRIAGMIQDIEQEVTPLQRKLDEFGAFIVKVCFLLVGLVFLIQWGRSGWELKALSEVFLTAISLAVAAIPEGLPAVVTIALALGVQRMVRRHALIRKLPSVETLGCATVICSDKTGTLTRNEMTVQAVFTMGRHFTVTGVGYAPRGEFREQDHPVQPADIPGLAAALRCGISCNAAALHRDGDAFTIVGDPTEGTLLTAAAKAGIEPASTLVEELPFDSERKMMTMIRRDAAGRLTAYVKGAPDILLAQCASILDGATERPLTDADRQTILTANTGFASQALRVLAMARRELPPAFSDRTPAAVESHLTFLGLVAMMDPPRQEAREAIAKCATAGIRAVMITGDHKETAAAVAKSLGMFKAGDQVLTGEELDRMDDSALSARIDHVPVYARVAPEHKLRIVRALRKQGHIVAMTGDGVNDAPAVKEADIGVAMGITGTDVTKEVSDMIVTDDNFASIVAAVEEGRGIYDNILKFVHYLLSCNTGEIMVMFLASLAGLPIPLLPIHILWVNLVTDGFPALALGVDPTGKGIMDHPPRDPAEPVVNRQRGILMLVQGMLIAFCTLAAFALVYYVEQEGLRRAQTAAFAVLSCSQLVHAFNCRSQVQSLFTLGIFSNPQLLLATGFSLVLQISVISIPFLSPIFKTEPLSVMDWLLVVSLSSIPFWGMETVKLFRRKFPGKD